MTIALLNFPSDLLGEVFKLCNPFELYIMSKCSKRARKSVTLGGTRHWKISYYESKNIWVRCGVDEYLFKHTTNPYEIYKTEIYPFASSGLSMFLDISDSGDPNLFTFLLDTFKITIVDFLDNDEQNMDFFRQLARIVIDRNMEIERVILNDTMNTKDVMDFMPLIHEMNITRKFSCFQAFPPNFQHQLTQYPNKIYISQSFWFSINQLLNCTSCTRIKLYDSMLTNQDLDVFLQQWKTRGAFPNLRWLAIRSREIDNESPILEMIPPIIFADNPKIKVSVHGHDDIIDAVRVTKEDGTVEWLKVELATLEFLIIRNYSDDAIVDGVRVTNDDGKEGWLKVNVGDWPMLKLLIVDPTDTIVEETTDSDPDDCFYW